MSSLNVLFHLLPLTAFTSQHHLLTSPLQASWHPRCEHWLVYVGFDINFMCDQNMYKGFSGDWPHLSEASVKLWLFDKILQYDSWLVGMRTSASQFTFSFEPNKHVSSNLGSRPAALLYILPKLEKCNFWALNIASGLIAILLILQLILQPQQHSVFLFCQQVVNTLKTICCYWKIARTWRQSTDQNN